MAYLPNGADERRQMLEAIGAASVEELFATVPERLRHTVGLMAGLAVGDRPEHRQARRGDNRIAIARATMIEAGTGAQVVQPVVEHVHDDRGAHQPPAGQAAPDLEATVQRMKGHDWPYAVFELFLGQRDPARRHGVATARGLGGPPGLGGGRCGGGGHGRPTRVAVMSWLSPPASARRLTDEKPASVSRVRSSSVPGR